MIIEIGEQATAMAALYKTVRSTRTESEEQFGSSFLEVIIDRMICDIQGRVDRGNKFKDQVGDSFNAIITYIKSNGGSKDLLTDLPTIVLYSLAMESDKTRKELAAADKPFLIACFTIVYRKVSAVCPYQVNTTEQAFLDENYITFRPFLYNIDKALFNVLFNQ